MSRRLHARTLNRIRYSDGRFSGHAADIHTLFDRIFGDECRWDDDSDTMEIDKAAFSDGIGELENMTEKEYKEICPLMQKSGFTKEMTVRNLRYFLKESDPDDSNVTLDWF